MLATLPHLIGHWISETMSRQLDLRATQPVSSTAAVAINAVVHPTCMSSQIEYGRALNCHCLHYFKPITSSRVVPIVYVYVYVYILDMILRYPIIVVPYSNLPYGFRVGFRFLNHTYHRNCSDLMPILADRQMRFTNHVLDMPRIRLSGPRNHVTWQPPSLGHANWRECLRKKPSLDQELSSMHDELQRFMAAMGSISIIFFLWIICG